MGLLACRLIWPGLYEAIISLRIPTNKTYLRSPAFPSPSPPTRLPSLPPSFGPFPYLRAAHGGLGRGEASEGEHGQGGRGTEQTSHCRSLSGGWWVAGGAVECGRGGEVEG